MSIQPPSDIVLDVARAADPATSLAATERLTRLGGTDGAADQNFTSALGDAAAETVLRRAQMTIDGARPTPGIAAKADPHLKVYKGLEALIFQNLVENMLPKDATDFFGTGTAGEIWRSMLAEQLGKQLSTRVSLGLAERVEALHPAHSAQHAGGTVTNAAFDAAIAGAGANGHGG